jgi:hypothetical protein
MLMMDTIKVSWCFNLNSWNYMPELELFAAVQFKTAVVSQLSFAFLFQSQQVLIITTTKALVRLPTTDK